DQQGRNARGAAASVREDQRQQSRDDRHASGEHQALLEQPAAHVAGVEQDLRPLAHSTQSARKRFVSPLTLPFRLLAKTSDLPSGENIGKPSKLSLKVTCVAAVPSSLIIQRSKLRPLGSATLDA